MANEEQDTGQFLVPKELLDEYHKIKWEVGKAEASEYYFEHLMPIVREAFEAVPEHKSIMQRQYSVLFSLMGFSPETTVLATLAVRPQKLVVAYTAVSYTHLTLPTIPLV